MRTVRELVWLTQLGVSIVCPVVLCLFGAIWLRDRFGLGNWVLFLGIALGLGGAFSAGAAFARDVSFLNRPGRGKRSRSKKPPISFNEHD